MDNAIYKLIDNVVAVNPSKTGASLKEIWRLSTHREKVVMREGSHNNPETVAAVTATPVTVVQAEGRVKEGLQKPGIAPQVSEAEQHHDKRWAESVTRKDLSAQFQSNDSPTRH